MIALNVAGLRYAINWLFIRLMGSRVPPVKSVRRPSTDRPSCSMVRLPVVKFFYPQADTQPLNRRPVSTTTSHHLFILMYPSSSANNYCLKYVDASFYQVARGLILPFTVALSFVFLKVSRPSLRILLACSAVTVGFFVGVFLGDSPDSTADETKSPSTTSALGIAFGLLSSLTTASHAIVIKRSLALVNGDALRLAWYSNVLSSIVLIPVIWLVGEGRGIVDLVTTPLYSGDGELSVLGRFLWGSFVTGIVGWLLSIAGVLSIKITSPITHMISSAVRGILQSAMGVWAFGDIITTGRGTSIVIILTGSMYYTWVKNEEVLLQREHEQHRLGGEIAPPRQPEEERALVFDANQRVLREDGDLESGYDLGEARHRPPRSMAGSIPLEQVETPDFRTEKVFEREK